MRLRVGILAVYTTELRTILENGNSISLNDYPIFDENYRSVLNTNIIDYYYFREIGFETVAQFNHYLNNKMNIIMPYYNKIYIATLKEINPLNNYNLTEKYEKIYEGTGNNTTNDSSNSDSLNAFSDTPQGNVSNNEITELNYLSEATQNKANYKNLSISDMKNNATENYIKNTSGTQGIPESEMIRKYIDSLLNIDKMIIEELSDLFMKVW
nr:MAG TPA: Lower collar protein [Caudoviricetes sp.]